MARSTQATPLAVSPVESVRTSEHRRHPRRKINSLVYLNIERDNGGILLDFSEGGMCISVANPLVKSSTIHFSLRLEENWRVDGTGRVSWVSASGRSAGVHFLDLPAGARQWILRGLGETSPPAETERAGILLETPPAAAQPDQPRIALAAAQPAPATCEPAKPAEGAPRQNSPLAIVPPAASTPTPVTDGSIERPDTPREPVSAADESGAGSAIPEMPLLFLLPPKPEFEERPAADSPIGAEPSVPLQESGALDGSEIKPVYAPLLQPRRIPTKREEFNRLLKDVLVTTAFVATVLAVGIGVIFLYTGGNSGTSRTVPIGGSLALGPSPGGAAGASLPRGERRFPVLATDSSGKWWVVMATGRMPIASESPSVAAGEKYSSRSSAASEARDATLSDSVLAGIPGPKAEGSLWGLDFSENRGDSATPETREARSATKQMEAGKPVIIEARVAKNGMVRFARFLSSPASPLAHSIEESVRHWRYRPLLRHGRAVAFTTRIKFQFPLQERTP